MDTTTRTIPADIADLAASWLAGLALVFEKCQSADDYTRAQAPSTPTGSAGSPSGSAARTWVDSAPGGEISEAQGVDEAQVQILMAITYGSVPQASWPSREGG